MNYRLTREILAKPWAIDAEYAAQVGATVVSFIENKAEYPQYPKSDNFDFSSVPEDVAFININGELMKNDELCGNIGMRTIGQKIKQIEKNEKIKGTVLIIDSPGGTVDGTRELVKIISQTEKPVVGLIDGLGASAAYWIASSCNQIIALDEFAKVGSIGVMMSFADMQPYWEKQGVKFHRIYASQSKDKNADFEKLIQGDYENYINETLNPLAQEFINSVKTFRNVNDDQVTGKTFFAKDVIGTMIDSIGSINDAVNFIYEFKPQNTISMEKGNLFSRIFSRKYQKDISSEEQLVEVQDEKIEELEKSVSELNAKVAELEQEKQNLASEKYEVEQQLAGVRFENENLQKQVEELKTLPGAVTTSVQKNDDGINDSDKSLVSDEKSFFENLEAVKKNYFVN